MSYYWIAAILIIGGLMGACAICLMLWFAMRNQPLDYKDRLAKAQKDFGNDFGAHG